MSGSTDPAYIYGNYLSRPASINKDLENAYKLYAAELVELANGSPILEVGSNDGLFLEFIRNENGVAVGIEPAKNLYNIASERNVLCVNDFVNKDSVQNSISLVGSRPGVILANHSFSNVEGIEEWATHLSNALKDNGYLVIQSFYQIDVLEKHMIENYNHEHLSYMTIKNTSNFFSRFGLTLEKVKHLPAKGGSIRFYFKKGEAAEKDALTKDLISKEKYVYAHLTEYFQATEDFISGKRGKLNELLANIDTRSKIAAYGTSIGATVFCYQFEIENKISCFFDDDPLRQNRFAPGSGVKVLKGRSNVMNDYSYIIILAPLYADAIIRNNLAYLKNGGKFVKFWPEVEIVSLSSYEAQMS